MGSRLRPAQSHNHKKYRRRFAPPILNKKKAPLSGAFFLLFISIHQRLRGLAGGGKAQLALTL